MKNIIKKFLKYLFMLIIIIVTIIIAFLYLFSQPIYLEIQQKILIPEQNIGYALYKEPAAFTEGPTNYILEFNGEEIKKEINTLNQNYLKKHVIMQYFRDDYIFDKPSISFHKNNFIIFTNNGLHFGIYDIQKQQGIIINNNIISGWNNYLEGERNSTPLYTWEGINSEIDMHNAISEVIKN